MRRRLAALVMSVVALSATTHAATAVEFGRAASGGSSRAAWITFAAAFGILALAVLAVAVSGRGVGPAPTLQREDAQDDDPARSTSTSSSET